MLVLPKNPSQYLWIHYHEPLLSLPISWVTEKVWLFFSFSFSESEYGLPDTQGLCFFLWGCPPLPRGCLQMVWFSLLLFSSSSLLGLSVSCLPGNEPLCWLTASYYDTLPHNCSRTRGVTGQALSYLLQWAQINHPSLNFLLKLLIILTKRMTNVSARDALGIILTLGDRNGQKRHKSLPYLCNICV